MFEEHTGMRDQYTARKPSGRMPDFAIRRLVKAGKWHILGKQFGFTPVFNRIGDKQIFDWRCLPKEITDALERTKDEPNGYHHRKPLPSWKKANRKHTPGTRESLYDFQEGFCYFCDNLCEFTDFTVDHLTPISRGGSNHISNKVGACSTCNHEKANQTEQEFLTSGYPPLRDGPHRTRYMEPIKNLRVVKREKRVRTHRHNATNYQPPTLGTVTGWPDLPQ